MTSVHRNSSIRRPVVHPVPNDVIFDAYFGKDFSLPAAVPAEPPLLNVSSETDRLLKQSHEMLSRLRQVIEERNGIE